MAQNKNLLSFRARLRSRGYHSIMIKRAITPNGERAFDRFGQELWYVSCIEPLLGWNCQFVVSQLQMNNWPGIAFDNCGYFSNDSQLEIDENGGVYV